MTVALQQRERFFRDGLARLLDGADGVHVVAAVATPEELATCCREDVPDVLLLDAPRDVPTLPPPLAALLGRSPRPRVVLLHRGHEAPGCAGVHATVGRHESFAALLTALRRPDATSQPVAEANGRLRLSHRETAVLALIADGCTTEQAATRLGVSPKTVESHVSRAFARLGTSNRAQAVAVALEAGLLQGHGEDPGR